MHVSIGTPTVLYHLERKLKLIAGIFSQLLKSLREKKNSPAHVTENIRFSRIHCLAGFFWVFCWVFDVRFLWVGGGVVCLGFFCLLLVGWLFLDSLVFTGLYRNSHHTYVIRVKIQQK